MSELQFFDELPFTPLESRLSQPGSFIDEAKGLMANPGKWALIKTFEKVDKTPPLQRAQNLKSVIIRKQYKAFRTKGKWEAQLNRPEGSEAVEVWARWLDTKDQAPPDPSMAPRVTRSTRRKPS